ncbi:MAG: hypothetical protein FRX49_07776 [Trebouxia sp. A1-2]|nr:MAG: hypothetical protein FRX49_07776 [Trebouxia sp. A1-2]
MSIPEKPKWRVTSRQERWQNSRQQVQQEGKARSIPGKPKWRVMSRQEMWQNSRQQRQQEGEARSIPGKPKWRDAQAATVQEHKSPIQRA